MQQSPAENLISFSDAGKLIAAHDGDVALLYIYMRSRGCDLEGAARELCRTMGEIEAAYEKLRRMGLQVDTPRGPAAPESAAARPQAVRAKAAQEAPAAAEKLPPAEELPEYRTEDIVRRSEEDPAFSAIVAEAQKVLGHLLSSMDMKKLFGIYDYLALPPEVVMELLNYCMSVSRGEDGAGRRPSMRFIEKEAYAWAHMEIFTFEQAEEYIHKSRLRREDLGRVSESLGIHGRKLTPTELKFINSWLDMGFSLELIELAYDRTVTNTGALKWGYMDKVLLSWHEKGLHTPAEVGAKEGRRAAPAHAAPADKPIDMDKLRAALDKM
ncbi:MAG: DnaD domain protein [Candidatus Limivicinus sp.]|nr:DnaD domain protein [Clostridiales bacterium]MDY3860751.1 DnaD domain protein [Candidatus Limivicinus sp.]